MDEKVSNRMDMIDLIAQGDMTYRTLLQELRTLEKRYNEVLSALSREEQNIICNFVS